MLKTNSYYYRKHPKLRSIYNKDARFFLRVTICLDAKFMNNVKAKLSHYKPREAVLGSGG